ncbi:hypothetical protein [[Clostridium] innocuum]|nr:hypothetical protein [[Clostridium] innocuum]
MKFATSLTSLACWLMAIVPGVYLLAYLSADTFICHLHIII